MNCKPGDIARVLTAGPFQDRLIRVTEYMDLGWGPEWFYEGSPLAVIDSVGDMGEQVTFFDRVLRPIRDPGDEAVDEISTRKPTERDATLTPKPQREHCL